MSAENTPVTVTLGNLIQWRDALLKSDARAGLALHRGGAITGMTAAIEGAQKAAATAAQPPIPSGFAMVPVEPTEAMHDAARDWSATKYGKPIGIEASAGCWAAMLAGAKATGGAHG